MAGPEERFGGTTAVITGAGSGIGNALAHRAAALGMNVVVADVDAGRLRRVRDDLDGDGATVLGVPTDVRDASSVDALADAAYGAFGSVGLLVNNAGIESAGWIWEMTPEHWHRVQGVNSGGVFHGIRSFVPRMGADPGASSIVNIASVAAVGSGTMNAAYYASKHAVLSMTESLYLECQQRFPQVGVSVVCPAAVSTRIFTDAISDRGATAATGDSATSQTLTMMRGHLRDEGITAPDAARLIFEGAASGRYWIPTHPERFAAIAGRRVKMLTDLTPPPRPEMS